MLYFQILNDFMHFYLYKSVVSMQWIETGNEKKKTHTETQVINDVKKFVSIFSGYQYCDALLLF